MRIVLLSSAVIWLQACATGAPAGGRSSMPEVEYTSFTPAATEREIPDAAPNPTPEVHDDAPAPVSGFKPGARDEAVKLARDLLGKKAIVLGGKRFGNDCSGLIRGIYTQLGLDVMSMAKSGDNAVTAIYRYAASKGRVYEGGRPVAGDLVFFRETYDVNRDGRNNDGLTHVGVVDEIGDDGTVYVIHRVARGVVRYRMNLDHKNESVADGRQVNDWLRMAGSLGKAQLTAQLFAGYATVLPVEPKFSASR